MRPLPRLHAITDDAVLDLEDFGTRAAAIAAAGAPVALHARTRTRQGAAFSEAIRRMISLARPPEASVFVNGRPDLARALGAQGVELATGDLSPRDARLVLGSAWEGWIGCSAHDPAEAETAVAEGADFLIVGSTYETASHPGRPPAGLALVGAAVRLGRPVIAIGGITAERVAEVFQAGAWGVAAISSLWRAADPAAATLALLAPWTESA